MDGPLRYYRPALAYAATLLGVVAIVAGVERLTRGAEPPSIVLITVDSLRADHLGVYGYGRETSPNIDALAERGVVFERAYTVETLSLPSHASLFTSLYPATHGVVYNGYRLAAEAVTLAELLRAAGYGTAAFVSDRLLDAPFGLAQGFEKFELSQVPTDPRQGRLTNVEGRSYHLARYWLRGMRERRFFLWLHCQQPHFSYNPIPPWDKMFDHDIERDYPYRRHETVLRALAAGRLTPRDEQRIVALYDGEVAFTDHLLGPLFQELANHTRPVVVVLTADHGDMLFDGGARRLGHGRGDFYEAAMRVPLIVVPPAGGAWHPGRVDDLVSSVDLLPTLAELAGLEPLAGLEGRSLTELLAGGGAGRDRVHAMYLKQPDRPTLAVRDERFKLIHRTGDGPLVELYDVTADPHELHDLAAERPDVAGPMTAELLRWFGERPERLAGAQDGLSPEVRTLLRQGGYLDDEDDDR